MICVDLTYVPLTPLPTLLLSHPSVWHHTATLYLLLTLQQQLQHVQLTSSLSTHNSKNGLVEFKSLYPYLSTGFKASQETRHFQSTYSDSDRSM